MVKENSTSIDMISNLPIEILCHILSFLPIKQAFSTTILSKRWTSLYKLLTHLHFDDESVSDEDAFLRYVSFVNTVMLSTELIKTFHIKYGSTHWQRVRNFNLIDSLIQTAKQHPVENLQLFSPLIGINLPPTIFSFPTLVVLKLTKFRITCNINISVIDLPSLKTLHLIGVSFKDEENFNKLLYGCPVLEDLVVFIFCIERFENASVVNTREFKPLSSLIRASIDETYVPLTALYNVKNLELEMSYKIFQQDIDSYYRSFRSFRNLIYLKLELDNFHHQWDNVVGVLQNCPKLQKIHILKETDILNLISGNTWTYPSFVPGCISFHLRSCDLNFTGIVDDLRFATFIIMNASLLEIMKINILRAKHPIFSDEEYPNQDALDEFTSCRRSSPNCKVSIDFP